MSTVAPILKTIKSFDAINEHVIEFSLDRMNRVPASLLVTIKDNATDEAKFTDTVAIGIGVKEYTIPANSLENNKHYKCSIVVYDPSGVPSPESNAVLFYCIPTPRFEFLNVPYQLNDSYLNVEMSYVETGTIYDPLQSFYLEMTNSKNQVFFRSEVEYVTDNSISATEIFNIEEDEGYILTAYGETSKGLLISVSQEIFVQFSRPSSFSALILDNMYDRGNIRLISNIKGLQGQVTGEEIYIDNEKIDLSLEGNEVLFDRGFVIKNDFYLKIYVENLQPNTKKPFLEIFQNEDYLKFYWREGTYRMYNNEPKDYIEMVQEYGTEYETYGKFRYIIQSNFIDPPQPTDKIFVGIKRINGYLQIKIENKGDA